MYQIRRAYFVLLFVFLSGSSPTVRIATFPSSYDFFHYRVPFLVSLDFGNREDVINGTWSVPDDCTLQKLRSFNRQATLEVLCSQPGTKLITLNQNDSVLETVRVTLDDNLDCYTWYAVRDGCQARQLMSGNQSINIDVWVVDHRHSSDEERNLDALFPSQHSKMLTFQFYSLGDVPELQLADAMDNNHFQVEQTGFNVSSGVWQFVVESLPGEMQLSVRGKGVIIYGCGIRDAVALISTHHVTVPRPTPLASLARVVTSGRSHLKQHQGEMNIAVLASRNGTYLSSNYFKTSDEFKLEFEGLSNVTLDDAAFVNESILLLISSTVYIVSLEDGSVISETKSVHSINKMQSAALAIRDPILTDSLKLISSAVAAWNGKNLLEAFSLSLDGGLSFSSISLPSSTAPLFVWSIAFHPCRPFAVLFAMSPNSVGKSKFYYFNYATYSWETQTSLQFNVDSNSGVTQPDFTWFPSGSGELLLWDSTRVYYSPVAGKAGSLLRLVEGPYLQDMLLQSQEFVHEVHTAADGTFAILTTRNQLFVGHAGTEYALLVTTVAQPGIDATLAFDSSSRLFLVTLQPFDQIEQHYVSWHQLAQNILQRDRDCPYIHWSSNLQNLYYMDMNEILQFWSYLVPMPWKSNELLVFVSDPNLVNLKKESAEQPAATAGIIVRNEMISLSDNTPVSSQTLRSSKLVSVKMMPVNTSLLCSSPREMVSHVVLGCPPHRTIKLSPRNANRCKSYASSKPPSHQLQYDYSIYGCPLRVKYGGTFLPTLELYDKDTAIMSVWANFAVIDEVGDSSLTYTHTARQVGCASSPDWLKQLQDHTDANFTVPTEGYYSCFNGSASASSDPSLHRAYPILNSSSPNRLRLSAHDGLYLFRVRIISNDYSYCDLETKFAVEIYGTPSRSIAGYVVLGSCCLFTIAVLIITYYFQRREIRQWSDEDKNK